MDEITSKASMPLPSCFNATREIPGAEMPRVTGKMRRSNAKQMMLFDVETDPYETNDVTEENPEIVNLLLEKLADYYVSQIFQNIFYASSNLTSYQKPSFEINNKIFKDEQVTPWNPVEEEEADPRNFKGVWKAWHWGQTEPNKM